MPVIDKLDKLLLARQQFAHGVQTSWFDHPNCIAFSRSGTAEQLGCVVIMSNGDDGEKTLNLSESLANRVWRDYLYNCDEVVKTNESGEGVFRCKAGSVSVWVLEEFAS
jgi:alpha-amylase